jgi:eukaryotic-like serine/threonine-protein kinase
MEPTVSEDLLTETFKYWAFISYSHKDKKWGDWLHRSLETYRVPKRISGQPTRDGPRPRRLFPIFRDREELPVSADLGSQINEALTQSRYLIVVCSPNSAKSIWVNEEIKYFKKLGREDRVLALIVAGEPNAAENKPGFSPDDECFPPALRYRIDSHGSLLPIRTEPVAGDAREHKDGRSNARLKLLAGLLRVNFDTLRQREHERRRRLLLRVTGLALLIAVTMSIVAVYAVLQAREARRQRKLATAQEHRAVLARKNAEDILNYLLHQLSEKLQPIGHLDIIEDVQKQVETYYKNLGFSERDASAMNSWAILLRLEAIRLVQQGDLNGAKEKCLEAVEIQQRLAKRDPGNSEWARALSRSCDKLGQVLEAQGDLEGAKAQYIIAVELLQKLVKQDPSSLADQEDLANGYTLLGNLLLARRSVSQAKIEYENALTISQELVSKDPSNTHWQEELSVDYEKIGDSFLAQGDLSNARIQYENGLQILLELVKQAPRNAIWEKQLAINYDYLGEVLFEQGDLNGAKTQFSAGVEVLKRLVAQDPDNSDWRGDLSSRLDNLSTVLEAQGDLDGAKIQVSSGIELLEQLVNQHPDNRRWEYSLTVGRVNLGEILAQKHDLGAAQSQLSTALESALDLVRKAPNNNDWQQILATAHCDLGDVLKEQGRLDDARVQQNDALEIVQKLIQQTPANPDVQNLSSSVHRSIGEILKARGDLAGARQAFASSFETLNKLIQDHGENPGWKSDLARLKKELEELEANDINSKH